MGPLTWTKHGEWPQRSSIDGPTPGSGAARLQNIGSSVASLCTGFKEHSNSGTLLTMDQARW